MIDKLGLEPFLRNESFLFEIEPACLSIGVATYANYGVSENIVMLNMLGFVTEGADLIPRSTSSYDPLVWSPIPDFLDAVEKRDPLQVLPEGDPFELCIHGMCVKSSALLLTSR